MEGRITLRGILFWFVLSSALLLLAAIAAYAYFWYAYLVLGRWPSQERMVPSGYERITEARQIDDLFGPAWHSISNAKAPDSAEWHTEAYFAGRYKLWMTVGVRVNRQSGAIDVVGSPTFVLLEIQSIQGDREVSDREVSYRGSSQREFGADEWRQVVEANGDFSAIGITLNLNNPVPGLDRYLAQPRNGMRLAQPK